MAKIGRFQWKWILTAVLRGLLAGLAVYFLCAGLGPMLTSKVQHAGTVVCIALGALLLFIAIWAPFCHRVLCGWWGMRWKRVLLCAAGALAAAGLVLCGVMSVQMIGATTNAPPEGVTVVVLGAGINGDRPSRMLADRLQTAAAYLKAHPFSRCIVSGGQGQNEEYAEAEIMTRYLQELGIEAERIYQESESGNTEENLRFSMALAQAEGLPLTIAVVTQEFHQYRGQQYAKAAGFSEIYALPCDTQPVLLPGYWIREWLAILKLWVMG